MNHLTANLAAFQAELAQVCESCGRNPEEISLVAITKNRSAAQINELLQSGVRVIGENRIQEALGKFPELKPCEKHFVGHLQSNKVREAVANFDCIESVDSVKLAYKLSAEAVKFNKTLPVFIQINIAREDTKSGFEIEELENAVNAIKNLPNLKIIGLMTIGPNTDDVEAIRNVFKKGFELKEKLGLPYYSAGMSDDWKIAVECGASHLRIGRILFKKN